MRNLIPAVILYPFAFILPRFHSRLAPHPSRVFPLFAFILPLLLHSTTLAADRYTIHTSGLNSSVYVNMLYFANLVNRYASDFTLITLPSDGGPTNMISVNDGKASFGTTTAESVKAAYEGSGDFRGKPQKRIRHVASFGFSLMFVYTHPDSPVQSISELKGKKIVYGGGTGSALLGRQILELYGLAKDVVAERGATESARAALERKEIDAVFTIARLPVPAYTELINRNALKLLPMEPEKIKALQKESPLYGEVDIRDFYPKYRISTKAVGLPGPLVARDDMNEKVIYQILKIVYANMDELQKMNEGFIGDSAGTGLRGLTIPLHSGAERFFKEQGIAK
jgi:TRAP transporter TAXI family solute receptor